MILELGINLTIDVREEIIAENQTTTLLKYY